MDAHLKITASNVSKIYMFDNFILEPIYSSVSESPTKPCRTRKIVSEPLKEFSL